MGFPQPLLPDLSDAIFVPIKIDRPSVVASRSIEFDVFDRSLEVRQPLLRVNLCCLD